MGVEKHLISGATEGCDRCGPKGKVGDEMAVHDIYMKPLQAEGFNGAGTLAEIGVIASQ